MHQSFQEYLSPQRPDPQPSPRIPTRSLFDRLSLYEYEPDPDLVDELAPGDADVKRLLQSARSERRRS